MPEAFPKDIQGRVHRFASTVAKERLSALFMGAGLDFDTPLSERRLAEAVGLGRMPVREALRDLARDGVVTVEAARGTFIRRIDLREIEELYEVRLALEGLAARLAAERGFVGALPELARSLRALRSESTEPHFLSTADALGDDLHWAVAVGAESRTLLEIYAGIRQRIRISLRLVQRRERSRILEALDEHVAIAEAILAQDSRSAMRVMREHLRRGHVATLGQSRGRRT
jgi:DNA-binding GntR family transcriptional regulator